MLLASKKPEVIYDATHEVLWNLDRIFRAGDLREQLWTVVERWPVDGLSGLHNRAVLANTVMALGVLETKEEWAGQLMATLSRLPRRDQLLAAIALSPYVVDRYLPPQLPATPWAELTPFFTEQLAAAGAIPEAERDWLCSHALVELPRAIQARRDPTAAATHSDEGAH